jgi:hypothetical protein
MKSAAYLAAFLTQNSSFAATLDLDDDHDLGLVGVVAQHVGHHAGGLFVMGRWVGREWNVKVHDSWDGPDEDGADIVVHIYHLDNPDLDRVDYVKTAAGAVDLFLNAERNVPVG